MNKGEFLQGLQSSLSGNVPPEVVRENLQYYSGYIRDEMEKGRRESEVLEELGDPRLIARTIIDTTPGGGEEEFEEYRGFAPWGGEREEAEEGSRSRWREPESNSFEGKIHYYDLSKWYWKLLGGAVLILVVALVIILMTGLISLLAALFPLIAAAAVVFWIVQRFRE